MTTAFVTIIAFLVTVGVLVVVHEYGHYLAARLMGVKILRFSVGFGKTLWKRELGPDRTEWVLAAIPLGGYVKMLDEREVDVPAHEIPRAFNQKSVAARIFIVLAGPAANFLLAFVLYWALFIAGMPGIKPVLGDALPNTAAAQAGFKSGDTVRAIGDEPVYTWIDVRWYLLKEAVRRGTVTVQVEGPDGSSRGVRSLDLGGLTADDLDQDFLVKLGLRPYQPQVSATIGRVVKGGAAERAGLREGDRIVGIDGRKVDTWIAFTTEVRASAGKTLRLEVERGAHRFELTAVPEAVGEGAARAGRLGVEAGPELKREYDRMTTTVRYGPVESATRAVAKVWDLSVFSLKMLGRMIVGDVSWKNLSGPITIADYAGQSAQLGWISFLGFLALVSVSLGVLNLLPIPLLDGGHLVYYLAEIAKGSPVSERTMEIGQRVGIAVLLGLTFFAFYNDLNRLFFG
ncbi:RIP metalloprotease RseP [Usitatibacter palustris]|uniref:Zinc metalloprotease n=1 Tax=Usitatibacter palustris TaxID=2732487 RepID=A0A6M4H668_9PROT|nr:RIP metalloprotease RseP [Usitatibacter palustris]QJR14153.1 Regulator of sigma-E protease RseP [Usitatibacter palustris]